MSYNPPVTFCTYCDRVHFFSDCWRYLSALEPRPSEERIVYGVCPKCQHRMMTMPLGAATFEEAKEVK